MNFLRQDGRKALTGFRIRTICCEHSLLDKTEVTGENPRRLAKPYFNTMSCVESDIRVH